MKGKAFGTCHPSVLLLYFLLVLTFSVCLMHPICLMISLISALGCNLLLRGGRALLQSFRWLFPVIFLAAAVNPLFVHRGVTVLGYFPGGNPLTLESILYGIGGAALLGAVLLWSLGWNEVFSSDKVLYLFGRLTPSLSLVVSMTLSFVPRLHQQLKATMQAQAALSGGRTPRRLLARLKKGSAVLSVLLTWSLEQSIETGDTMKSRGYGLPGRTTFSNYRMTFRDKGLLLWLVVVGGGVLWGWAGGALAFSYYPAMMGAWSPTTVVFLVCYLALCLTPAALEGWEELQWNRSISKHRGIR